MVDNSLRCTLLPIPSGPIPILAAPPAFIAFSKTTTDKLLSAADIAAANPDGPAATTTTSQFNSFITIILLLTL
ncbi:hypothetical protein D3C81_1718240 [compost metagenome]